MLLLILLFFITLLLTSPALIQTSHEIFDLNTNDATCFLQETSTWSYSSSGIPPSSYTYNCNGDFLLGGVKMSPSNSQRNKYFEKSYSNIPAHSSIRFTLTMFAIDQWEHEEGGVAGDYIQFMFNSVLINLFRVNRGDVAGGGKYTTKLCGVDSYPDLPNVNIYGSIDHTDTNLVFKIISQLSGSTSNEAFGVRKITLTFSDTPTSAAASACSLAPATVYDVPTCACAKGQYSGVSGCTHCDTACDSCYGAGPSQCFLCKEGYYFDGTQCLACDSSCSRCTGPKSMECMECYSGYQLFENICIADSRCSAAGGFTSDSCSNQCSSPCSSSDRANWLESCVPPCPTSPAKALLDFSGLCLTCNKMSVSLADYDKTEYEYEVSLSPSTCDLDLRAFKWHLQITEQASPKILSEFSISITKTGIAKYKIHLSFQEQPKEQTLLLFTLKHLSKIAQVPTSATKLLEEVETPKAVVAGVLSGSLVSAAAIGATSALWSIISFQQFVGYFIFVNIKFPSHVEYFLSILSASFWDYLPNPLARMTDDMYKDLLDDNGQIPYEYKPPAKFREYDVISFFIKDSGEIIATNLLLLFILALVLLIKSFKKFHHNKYLKRIKIALKWNIIARTFLENGIPLSLSIFLQLRIMSFDNLYLAFCSSLGIIAIVLVLSKLTFLIKILAKRDNKHLEQSFVRRMYGTLYEGVLLQGWAKYYQILILLRGITFVCILVFCGEIPLVQIIYAIFCSVFLIYFMFKTVNLEDGKLSKIVRIKEILILLGEICMLLLYAEVASEKYYDIVGWLMLGALGSVLGIEVVYMLIIQIFGIKTMYQNAKKSLKKMKDFVFGNGKSQKNEANELKDFRVKRARVELNDSSVVSMQNSNNFTSVTNQNMIETIQL